MVCVDDSPWYNDTESGFDEGYIPEPQRWSDNTTTTITESVQLQSHTVALCERDLRNPEVEVDMKIHGPFHGTYSSRPRISKRFFFLPYDHESIRLTMRIWVNQFLGCFPINQFIIRKELNITQFVTKRAQSNQFVTKWAQSNQFVTK